MYANVLCLIVRLRSFCFFILKKQLRSLQLLLFYLQRNREPITISILDNNTTMPIVIYSLQLLHILAV